LKIDGFTAETVTGRFSDAALYRLRLTPSENSSHFRARWRWRQCTPLELQIVLRPARPARPVGSDQQVLQTVAKTYPNCTLRTPAAPFLPSLAAPSPYFQLRDGLVCAWRWSAGPHMTQGHGIRLFHDHACPIGVGYSHSSPFPSFPTWPHCDRFFVQVKWS
jgi:hypothetical protein